MAKKSEIQQELEDNYNEMMEIIQNQALTVKDANRYIERYYNVIRKMEDLEKSRDTWKYKFEREKEKNDIGKKSP